LNEPDVVENVAYVHRGLEIVGDGDLAPIAGAAASG
jgi:hypothetical protein